MNLNVLNGVKKPFLLGCDYSKMESGKIKVDNFGEKNEMYWVIFFVEMKVIGK